MIDLAKPEQADDPMTREFLAMTHYKREKISSKKRPTVFFRGDDRISQIDAAVINGQASKFPVIVTKETALTPVHSMRELADNIGKFNSSLNDTTIVYCKGDSEDDLKKTATKAAVRLMRQESLNPLLVVDDKEL